MKYRVLDVMNDALGLVKKSDLRGATALIRKALSGETATEGDVGDAKAPSRRPSAKVIPLPPRRPLGETLRALRLRPIMPPGLPDAPETGPAPDFGESFLRRTYSGPAGSLNYRLYVPADHERRALVLMLHGCLQNPEDFARGTRMNDLAEEFGLIVAYPHQTRRANPPAAGTGSTAAIRIEARANRPNWPAWRKPWRKSSTSEGTAFSRLACRRAGRWRRFSP